MSDTQQHTNGPLPDSCRGWNWGAFFLNWIWGFGNNTFIALLCFVPMVGFIMPFILGAKGNEWAWQNGSWRSAEHFKQTQRKWTIASLIILGIILLIICLTFGGFFALFEHYASQQ